MKLAGEINPYHQVDSTTALTNPVDVVIPFTYSSVRNTDGYIDMSTLSRMAIDAALIVADANDDSTIVIASERTHGRLSASTAELMVGEAISRGMSATRLEVVEWATKSYNNTPRQVAALTKFLLSELDYTYTPLLVAHDYHIPRLLRYAQAYGLRAAAVSVQDLMEATDMHGYYPPSEALDDLRRHEAVPAMISLFDPKGRLLRVATSVFGPQIHDVIRDDAVDGYKTITGWARWPLSLLTSK